MAHATYCAVAVQAGAKPHELDDWEDPADVLAGQEEPARSRDPAERAAQITAFLATTGSGDVATTTGS